MPTVMIANWMMSVSVSDHMPPVTQYRTTTPPAISTATVVETPSRLLKTVPDAIVEVTAIISAYAAMIAALTTRAETL